MLEPWSPQRSVLTALTSSLSTRAEQCSRCAGSWRERRFPLGVKITITARAVEALGEASQHAVEFLVPHARGDWGAFGRCDHIELTADELQRGWEATDDSAKINKSNLLNGRDRIMSEYQTNCGIRLWVITCLDGAVGTTVLLPEEY